MAIKGAILKDLESLVTRLIGLPDYINSPHKKQRKYGDIVYNGITRKIAGMIKKDSTEIWELEEDTNPFYCMPQYQGLIRKKDYKGATKYARDWLRALRKEYDYQNNGEI